jgi:hypothetical protein
MFLFVFPSLSHTFFFSLSFFGTARAQKTFDPRYQTVTHFLCENALQPNSGKKSDFLRVTRIDVGKIEFQNYVCTYNFTQLELEWLCKAIFV